MFDSISKKIFESARDAVRNRKQTSTTTTNKPSASSRAAKAVREVFDDDLGEYTVTSGDSLSAIAQRFYGDASKWTEIYDANKSVIGSNPNMIQVGQTFTIPRLD